MALAIILAVISLAVFAESTPDINEYNHSAKENTMEVFEQNACGFLNDSADNLLGLDNEDLNTFFYKPAEHILEVFYFLGKKESNELIDLKNIPSELLFESDLSPPHLS